MKRWSIVCGILVMLISGVMASPARAFDGRLVIARPLRIDEPVHGDIVCLGTVVRLGPHAHVSGDVITIFGRIERADGATIGGRIINVASLAGLDLSAARSPHPARIVWGLRCLIWGFWILMTSLVTLAWPVTVGRGVWIARHLLLRSLLVGVMAVITLVGAMVASVAMGPAAGIPAGVAVMVVFLAAKVFGLSVLTTLLGRWILLNGFHLRVPEIYEAFTGVTVLFGVRMVPWLGGSLWALVSVCALGVAILTPALHRAIVPSFASADRAPSNR